MSSKAETNEPNYFPELEILKLAHKDLCPMYSLNTKIMSFTLTLDKIIWPPLRSEACKGKEDLPALGRLAHP